MKIEGNAELRKLLIEARAGSEAALSELIAKYEPLILSLLSKFSFGNFGKEDHEDLHQEMLIIFCNAVMKYNLEQTGVDFGLYAKICMERGLVSQLRAAKKRAIIESVPSSCSDFQSYEFEDPSINIVETESIREMWKLINENLSEYENKVWNLHLSGLSSSEIAKEVCRDGKSIDNALCRIRAKLRKALKRQYR